MHFLLPVSSVIEEIFPFVSIMILHNWAKEEKIVHLSQNRVVVKPGQLLWPY